MRAECSTVAELLADPKAWTQHVEARDAAGHEVGWYSPNARSWCLLGALARVYDSCADSCAEDYQHALSAMTLKLYSLYGWLGPVGEWQDAPERTYAEVYGLVQAAGV